MKKIIFLFSCLLFFAFSVNGQAVKKRVDSTFVKSLDSLSVFVGVNPNGATRRFAKDDVLRAAKPHFVNVVGTLPSSGNNSYRGHFAKEGGGSRITAYVDTLGNRWSIGESADLSAYLTSSSAATTYATKSSIVDSASQIRDDFESSINYVKSISDTRDDSIISKLNNNFTIVGTNIKGGATALSTSSGNNNIAIGDSTLFSAYNTNGNVAIGNRSLVNFYRTGRNAPNTAIGYTSLYSLTTGGNNTAIGNASMYNTTTGSRNMAIGVSSLYDNILGDGNVSIGNFTLWKSLRSNNTAIGDYALQNAIDSNNTAIGSNSFRNLITGTGNIAIGDSSALNLTSGSNNIVIGKGLGISTTASNQLFIGNWITGDNGAITIPNRLTVQKLNQSQSITPSSSSDTQGNTGDIARDDNYIYVKTSSGWKRAALSTF